MGIMLLYVAGRLGDKDLGGRQNQLNDQNLEFRDDLVHKIVYGNMAVCARRAEW